MLPLLHHYAALQHRLLLHLALAHRTLSKLLSILLALFTDLVAKVQHTTISIDRHVLVPVQCIYMCTVPFMHVYIAL